MTRLAAFEAGEGKKSMAIGTYFRGDYIAKEIIKSVIYGTISFVVILGVYLAYDFEKFMENIYEIDLWEFGKAILYRYILVIVIYAGVGEAQASWNDLCGVCDTVSQSQEESARLLQ